MTDPAHPVPLAVEPAVRSARQRRHGRATAVAAPYTLLLPALVVIVLVLGYPLYKIVVLSFQKYGLFELIRHKGRWVGTANYATIFHDGEFWRVVLRTFAFTAVCVSLTMVLGTAIALLNGENDVPVRARLRSGA